MLMLLPQDYEWMLSETMFSPDSYLTRGQMAHMLVGAYRLQEYAKETPFTDLTKSFSKDIEAIYGAGITGGISDDLYGTKENIKRGDFAVLLYKTKKSRRAGQSTPKVKSVNPIESISVTVGTSIAEMKLPNEAEVVYDDDSVKTLNVQWDMSGLNIDQPGEYVINGQIEGISETASVKVIVHGSDLETIADIDVSVGTKVENLDLPKQVKATYFDGTTKNLAVTWELTGLNLDQSGEYVINGELEENTGETSVKIIVHDVDLAGLADIGVSEGTKKRFRPVAASKSNLF